MAHDDQKKNLEGQVNSKAPWVVFYTSPTDTGGLLPLWAGSFNEKQRMEACDRYVTEFILEPAALLGAVQNVKADCKAQMDALPADHPHRGNYQRMYDSLEEQEIAIADGLRRHADLTMKLPQFTPEIAQVVVQAVHNTILRTPTPIARSVSRLDKAMADYAGYRKEIAEIRASLEATAEGFADSAKRRAETPLVEQGFVDDITACFHQAGEEFKARTAEINEQDSRLDKAIETYDGYRKEIAEIKTSLETTAKGFAESTHPHTETPPTSLLDKAIENYPHDKKTIGDLKVGLEATANGFAEIADTLKPKKEGE